MWKTQDILIFSYVNHQLQKKNWSLWYWDSKTLEDAFMQSSGCVADLRYRKPHQSYLCHRSFSHKRHNRPSLYDLLQVKKKTGSRGKTGEDGGREERMGEDGGRKKTRRLEEDTGRRRRRMVEGWERRTCGKSSEERRKLTDEVSSLRKASVRRGSAGWPAEGRSRTGRSDAVSTGPGSACQGQLWFLKPVQLWVAVKAEYSLVLLIHLPAFVSRTVWSHWASVDTVSAYRGEQAPGERKNNQTLRSNFLSRVQHVVRSQLRGLFITLCGGTKQWKVELGKWKGRSSDCPPGKFSKWWTESLCSSGPVLLNRQTPVTRSESPRMFLSGPGVPPFRSMNVLRFDFSSGSERWLAAVRHCSVINSTMGRVSPKRRNCFRMSSSSSGVTINQRSNTFPPGNWSKTNHSVKRWATFNF